ncbi:hypothetical protein Tco_0144487, partial [Tanacetum coccineum]
TQLNLTKPRWEATGFEFKHDYTVIDSPRAVTFRDRYGVQMIMRFNEIHKFSDGTLQQIDEALDYRVKEFQINRTNPGMNTRFWTKKDVDRSKDFMFAIQKRLKTRRIFRNLESFVGGRIREGDYRVGSSICAKLFSEYRMHIIKGVRMVHVPMIPPEPEGSTQGESTKTAKYGDFDGTHQIDRFTYTGNPVKEILLKLNLPDHRSVLTDPEDQAKMEMVTLDSQWESIPLPSQVGPSGGVDGVPSVRPRFDGRRYEKGGIVAIVEGEAHGALGLRGGLLGVQTQSHIGKIIISKLTYKLGGLLLLSPIGFRMEPQLGLYVRLGEILGLRFPTIGIRANGGVDGVPSVRPWFYGISGSR